VLFAQQMRRQRLLRGRRTDWRARTRRAGTVNIGGTTPTRQILQFGFEPLDPAVQLLGFCGRTASA
jgi:hypothetical protein